MLGNITQNTGNNSNVQQAIDLKLNGKITDLTNRVESLESDMQDLSEEVLTENVITDDLTVNTNLNADTANLGNTTINGNETVNGSVTSNSVKTDSVMAENVTANLFKGNISGQVIDTQSSMTIDSLTSTSETVSNLTVSGNLTLGNGATFTNEATIPSLNSTTVTATNANVTNVTSSVVSTDTVTSNTTNANSINTSDVNTKNIEISENATIDNEQVRQSEIANLNVTDSLKSFANYGRDFITLTPAITPATTDYFLIKIAKHDLNNTYYCLDNIKLDIKDNFSIKFITAFKKSNADIIDPDTGETILGTKGTTLVLLHQASKSIVYVISEDSDYFYLQIKPTNTDGSPCELYYSYESSLGKIDNIVSYEYNNHPTYNWYFRPEGTADIIMLGDKTSKYQFTVLGKLKADIEMPETTEFDNIQVNHSIYTRTNYNSFTQTWNYKKDSDNQYLSSVNEYYDSDIEQWVTHIEWKSPIDNDTVQAAGLTEDIITEYEEPLDEGTRTVQSVELGTKEKLITYQTLANYNGKKQVLDSDGTVTSEENNITKLGTVDEGTWIAGDVTTPNLEVDESMNIKPESITWHEVEYNVWNDGSSSSLDLDWVNV